MGLPGYAVKPVTPYGSTGSTGTPERLGGLDRRTLGKDVVGLEREVRMLLGRADGEHDPVVSAQVGLELHPVEVADSHRDARTLTPKPNPRLGECSGMSPETDTG